MLPDLPAQQAELRSAIAKHVEQRQQQGAGAEPQVLLHAQLQHRLPFRSEPYTLTLHVPLPPCSTADAHPAAAAAATAAAASPGKQQQGGSGGQAAAGAALDLRDAPHRLQQWLGLRAFLLLTPDSYSGRVLDAEVG